MTDECDSLVATSMVDLAVFTRNRTRIGTSTDIAYFHENQFDYPLSESAHASIEPNIVNLYSAVAAQRGIQ